MQGRKTFTDEKELHFSLSAHVPEHSFYRQLKQQLDLNFLYELTGQFYGRCGQQSIDPVVFFKLCLVGYLENIISDRKLIEHCSMAVDTAKGVISHVRADFGDGRDSQHLPSLVMQVQGRLKENALLMQELLADAGYSNGSNYHMLEQQGITGWIPVFGKYKPEIEAFPYDKESDRYMCPMGKPHPFKGFDRTADGRLLKNYWAAPADCRQCASKPTCAPKARCRKITRTAYDEQYQRAYARQNSRRGKRMKKLRQSTVDPVFGTLVQHYGLRRIGVLGKSGAHKVMLMAAVAFNLKKYMKYKPSKSISVATALEKERQQSSTGSSFLFSPLFFN
ncbi:transposase [Pontibacter akesuensis]|uniref:Transposase domain n=1 Tax=Pontibacter akesuensis TaxID=388950 RepID=A0A1I7KQK6_9BACT|nr:transposase [Pontibacter akesuensis]GHA81340.1 hypothetical protein GCM10007389_39840 [Pontibacter akesuensis]SFU99727.1 Transposase domain [Pontibacter akesuensis]